MFGLEFKNPEFLLLLVPFAAGLAYYFYRRLYARNAGIAISSRRLITEHASIRVITYPYVKYLRLVSIVLLIIALARPGREISYSSVKNLGIDIMIALDISGSMKTEDFKPRHRLAVAKQVLKDFVVRRLSDRIGLVVFAGEAYLQCPLTAEHQMIADIVDDVDFGTVKEDGTAIGDALALAASRMMESKSKNKIILLITDGANNAGSIDPETAAKAGAEMGIKIYAVGIGKKEQEQNRLQSFFRVQYPYTRLDEKTLKTVTEISGGKYYIASSSGVLWENIKDIDRLEKSEVEVKVYHEFHDRFDLVLVAGIALFLVEILLRAVFYRKIP